MSKFNTKNTTRTTNHEGGVAYTQSPEQELYVLVCNSLLEDKFYESKEEQKTRLLQLTEKVDKHFLINLIVYARKEMYLRSIVHLLVVEYARLHKGNARGLISLVCERTDDMTEILAYHISQYGKPIPNQIKKGMADVFPKFGEYALAKYNRKGLVSLKDVIRICHVYNSELVKKTLDDRLEIPYTWETKLSSRGNSKEVWAELIKSGKLGYMALLRNLRNILNVIDDINIISDIAKTLTSPEKVKKSKQFPFRFFSAYRELKENSNPYTSIILKALDEACGLSVQSLKLSGVSMIASDVSGSMEAPVSSNSRIKAIDIGLVMQGLAKKVSPLSITGIFGDSFKIKNYSGNSIFEAVDNYREGEVGYSTNGYLVIEYLTDNNIKVDNILIFTDQEMYGGLINSSLQIYKKTINKDVKVFIFNLAGYSTVQFPEKSVYSIGGWSEKVFDYIESVEAPGAIISKILNYDKI